MARPRSVPTQKATGRRHTSVRIPRPTEQSGAVATDSPDTAPPRRRPVDPLVRCDEVTKDYGSTRALGPISFEIQAGEAVGLVGHNGSGKSTLLALIAGAIEPTSGSVSVAGVPAGERSARATVSYVPDTPVLYDDLSLREHLDYLSRLHGTTPENQATDALVESFGLSGRLDDLPVDFSRGLKQKAAVTIGVCRPYRLLLLDEPLLGLDTRGRETLVELITQVRAEGGSVLASTHDRDVLAVFDRVLNLEEGLLVD